MCIEYHIQVNMYHVSAQGVDERMINVHYYYQWEIKAVIQSYTLTHNKELNCTYLNNSKT